MIELPADLAEVLKTVQSNENGKDIAFPDGNEELLAQLATAWDKWNEAADTHVQAIAQAAQRAMASMAGPAADSFQQYLQKFAAGDGSHVSTTLQAGHGLAQGLHGAARAVVDTKNEMIRELQYAKEYIEQNPAGKHDDIAESEGIKQAAATYHQYVGLACNDIDSMLRKSAGHISDMTGMGKTCALNGAGGAEGPGGAGTAGGIDPATGLPSQYRTAGGIDPATGLPFQAGAAGGIDPVTGLPFQAGAAGGIDPVTGLPFQAGAAGGIDPATGLPFQAGASPTGAAAFNMGAVPASDAFAGGGGGGGGGSSSGAGTAAFSMGAVSASDAFAGGDGYGASGAAGGGGGADTPRLKPFTPLTPTLSTFGGGAGVGDGTPVFTPLPVSPSHGSLNLAGLSDLGGGAGGSGLGSGSGLAGGLGGGLGGGSGGSGTGGLSPFGGAGGLGSSLGGALGGAFGGGGGGAPGLGGAKGTASVHTGGLGSASAGRTSGAFGAVAGSGFGSGAGSGSAASRLGGTAGGGMAGGGMAGGHMPGAGGGGRGGGKEARKGNRFLSPTRFGVEGEEEEGLPAEDAGILGQAGEAAPRERQWQGARRRWLDDARTEGTFGLPETTATETAAVAGPTSEQAVLNQLAGVLLGAGSDPGAATSSETSSATSTATETASSGTPAVERTDRQAVSATAESTGETDEGYLERSRAAAARRGHPDAPAVAAPASAPAAAAAPTAAAGPAPLREEGGYQVPSPFLRAALTRLAAPVAD